MALIYITCWYVSYEMSLLYLNLNYNAVDLYLVMMMMMMIALEFRTFQEQHRIPKTNERTHITVICSHQF